MFRWHFWCFFFVFTLVHERCLLLALAEGNAEVANTAVVTSSKTLLTSPDLKTITTRRPSSSARKVINLPILALLDLSPLESKGQRINGSSLLKTAQQAIRSVNRRQIIPGHHLQLLVNDSKCDSGAGVDAFFHAIYTTKDKKTSDARPFLMLLGPHCSHVTETIALVTPYWNVVQISHAAQKAGLSDRQKFPNFFRTAITESTHNAARLAFLHLQQWDSVSILVQNEDDYSLVINDLSSLLEDANITVSNLLTFSPDESDITDQLEILQHRDARIIIGSFAPSMALSIFCEVHRRGLFGPDHVWFLPGSVFSVEQWLELLMSQQQNAESGSLSNSTGSTSNQCNRLSKKDLTAVILAVAEGSFFFQSHRHPIIDPRFPSYQIPPLPDLHGEIYDAVWTMALALKELQSDYELSSDNNSSHKQMLADFDYTRKDMAENLMNKISRLSFEGASGLVSFSGANRIGTTALFQIQKGIARRIGLFHPSMGLDLNGSWPISWASGSPPVSTRIIKYRIETIEPAAFYTVTFLASLGIAFAFVCLYFNLAKRKLKYIKLSSPQLNNIAIIGSTLVYGAVILMGVDHATLIHESAFPFICMGRAYFLSAGFSLAFGAMFTKTFRVHRIFSMRNSLIKNKLLADKQLIGLILVLLVMDSLIIGFWVFFDKQERELYNLKMVVDPLDRSVVYQPQVEVCRSDRGTMWLGILYLKKGLLLIAGVYMAWETRNVTIPALNDSPYIGMNVYNAVITSCIVVFCESLLSERITLNYIVVATLILTSTTTALCLLFLPKFHAAWKQAHGAIVDPIYQSTGLRLELNTRRMVLDDRKELLARAEIMNRVYQRDISNLDTEIQRLERILTKELHVSISTLDEHYSSVIQAEVSRVYAILDQEPVAESRPCTWDLPKYVNKLVSRSCVTLYDTDAIINRSLTASCRRSQQKATSRRNPAWNSASCIAEKEKSGSSDPFLSHSMNGSIKSGQFYKLVDRNLLGAAIKINPSSSDQIDKLNRSSDSDDLRSSNEIILSFEW